MCNEKQPNLPYKQDYVKTSQYFYRKLYHFFSNAGKTGNVRSSRSELFLRKGVLKICSKFTGEHLATLLKKRLWHRCFPVDFAKFLKAPSLQNTSR